MVDNVNTDFWLVNLVKGDGLKFGAVSTDPNDLTYVAPGAISNISQIEYDYSDYYDDLEEDSDKTKREAEVEVRMNNDLLSSQV